MYVASTRSPLGPVLPSSLVVAVNGSADAPVLCGAALPPAYHAHAYTDMAVADAVVVVGVDPLLFPLAGLARRASPTTLRAFFVGRASSLDDEAAAEAALPYLLRCFGASSPS